MYRVPSGTFPRKRFGCAFLLISAVLSPVKSFLSFFSTLFMSYRGGSTKTASKPHPNRGPGLLFFVGFPRPT